MASEQEYPKERAALLADWRQRLKNQQEADHALFMHVNDLEPGVLVIEQLQQQLAQAREQAEALQKRDGMLTEANAEAVTRYAQAREELAEQLKKENTYLPFLGEQNKQFEEWMHQARALLEEVAGKIYPAHWKGSRLMYCDLCNEHGESLEQIAHRPGCLAAKARAFLAREEGA